MELRISHPFGFDDFFDLWQTTLWVCFAKSRTIKEFLWGRTNNIIHWHDRSAILATVREMAGIKSQEIEYCGEYGTSKGGTH